jgi:undecaprenyl phosphate-alpha-L-ara4FN deformylase
MATVVGLKVDVDTLAGYLQGVPVLLDKFAEAGVQATFFFSVGPDRSGMAIRRVFTQRGFLGKMIRNRAPATFGWRTMLYGTLLPAPLIAQSDPGIVRAVAEAGHEVGVHGWDHIGWHDGVGRLAPEVLREQLGRAYATLTDILGRQPRCFAAPGWQCSRDSLTYHDERELLYASDVRGTGGAFRPRLKGEVFLTPQLPTNLPTLDEMWGLTTRDEAQAAQQWLAGLRPGTNVLTVHTEMEGMALPEALPNFLQGAAERGVEVCPLERLVEGLDPLTLPIRDVVAGRLPGRAGKVWCVV